MTTPTLDEVLKMGQEKAERVVYCAECKYFVERTRDCAYPDNVKVKYSPRAREKNSFVYIKEYSTINDLNNCPWFSIASYKPCLWEKIKNWFQTVGAF